MWSFASNAIAGSLKKKAQPSKCSISNPDCSDDEVSSCTSREEGLDCPICWESFNLVENVPYVLWCGHTMCKNCILGLHWAVVKFPSLPIQLPLFISCPWCNLLSFRLVYKGNLRFPRKNYFLLWMVESMNGERAKFHSTNHEEHHSSWHSSAGTSSSHQHRRNADSQVSTRDNLPADSPLCCPCKCCCSGPVCPCHVFVCTALIFDPLLCLSQLGLAC